MKQLLIIGLIGTFSIFPIASSACPGKFGDKLGLTDDQKARVEALKDSLGPRNKDGTPEERKTRRLAFKEGMKAILTPEQNAKLQESKNGCKGKKFDDGRPPEAN